ncbi:hypothetical protein OVA13_12865 [Pseudoxanthomonas sp. SL93]|uniref:hypothetical protein n=1 Tax=Pseudoxanthomonas sp. SL93 TaxID=2995142 RepID=UPI00226F4F99|nr:hypothetical protein [Pseudoxanthomonas sp. SL93]WAC62276.1 hypothetical protein OVA13_12865 [Pseudoxanthomonas sp. SL93]
MRHLILLSLLLTSTFTFAQSVPPHADVRQYLVVVAHQMRIAQSFKHGINAEKTRSGSISGQAQAALQMDDKQLEELFADVLASKISIQEAREAYEFHSSVAGEALIASQARDPMNPSPTLNLTPPQIVAINAYMSSPTGKKLGALISSSATWDEFSTKVTDALERP